MTYITVGTVLCLVCLLLFVVPDPTPTFLLCQALIGFAGMVLVLESSRERDREDRR